MITEEPLVRKRLRPKMSMTRDGNQIQSSSSSTDVREWQTTRKETTYVESRHVLDAQREMLSDIDEKAMRTVRLTAVLIGVFVATARVTDTSIFHPLWATVGVGLLFLSIVLGTATYNESDGIVLGPSRTYVEQLARNRIVGREWDDDYLMTAGYWIGKNYDILKRNSHLLTSAQVCFILGLAAMVLAVAF